jgi:hypothetical protein
MITLTLVQTSPGDNNPDRNIVKVGFVGNYPGPSTSIPVFQGGDPLPLNNILDPQINGQVPMPNVGNNPPPVTPYPLNEWLDGYFTEIQRVTVGTGPAAVTTFYLHLFAPGGTEVAAGTAYSTIPAAPYAGTGEVFLEILVPVHQQS